MEGRQIGKEGRRKERKKEGAKTDKEGKEGKREGGMEGGKCAQTGANTLSVHTVRLTEAASLRATRLVSFDV